MATSVDSSSPRTSTPAPAPAPAEQAKPAAPAPQPSEAAPKPAPAQTGFTSKSTFETTRSAPVALTAPAPAQPAPTSSAPTYSLRELALISGTGAKLSVADEGDTNMGKSNTPAPAPADEPATAEGAEGADENVPMREPGATSTSALDTLSDRDRQTVQRDYENIKKYPEQEQWAVAVSAFSRYENADEAGDTNAKARAAALVELMKNDSTGMLDRVVAGAFERDGNGAPLRGPDDQNAVTFGLRAAHDAGVLTDDDLAANASKPGWADATGSVKGAVLDDVYAAQAQVNDLKGQVDTLDQQLAGELANFGPALTDEQRTKYTQAFRSEHPEYAQLEVASKEYGKLLEDRHVELANLAVNDPVAAEKLFNALEAGSKAAGSAPGVVKTISEIYKIAGSGKVQSKDYSVLLKDALPLAAAALSGTSADTQAAFQRFSDLVKPILDVDGKARGVQKAWDKLDDVANKRDFSRLADLKETYESGDDLTRGLSVAALVFGAQAGVDSAQKGDYLKAVNQLASASKGGLELVAGATEALSDTSRFFATVEKSAFPQIAERLIPGLGLVVSATALGLDVRDATQGVDPGKIAKIVGDTISVTGAVIETIPGGELAGGLINAVGGLVTAGGSVVSSWFQQSALEKDRRKHLTAAGITGDLQDTLIDASGSRVHELADELGISPPDIQQLAQKYPTLLTMDGGNGYDISAVKQLANAFALTPREVTGLLNRIGEGSSDPAYTLYVLAENLMRETGGEPRSPQQFEELLQRYAQMPGAHNPDFNVGFANALSFLQNLEITRYGT